MDTPLFFNGCVLIGAIGDVMGWLSIAHKSVGVGLSANQNQQNHLPIKTHPCGLPMNVVIL
jgi:hypothetical protein